METVTVPIKDLKISGRIRRELGDIEGLAASIQHLGLLQPIVITRENELLAGGRRVAAHIHMKRDAIEAVYYDAADEITKREVELEENLKRKELTWVEEVKAIRDIFELKQKIYGIKDERGGRPGPFNSDGYGLSQASDDLERSKAAISQDIALARALDIDPTLADEKSKTAAMRRYVKNREIALRTEQAKRRQPGETVNTKREAETAEDILASLGLGDSDGTPAAKTHQPATKIRKAVWKNGNVLYHGDSREILRQMPDASVDCLVTDPPYALNMFREGEQTSNQRLADAQGQMYDDDPHRVMDMLDEVMMHCGRILKPNGHAYVFFHMTRYDPIFLMLEKHFGHCDPVPLIWVKNTPGIGNPNDRWVYAYEPCFWVNRGNKLVKPQAFNYLRYDTVPPGSKIHPTEKPLALLAHIIQASCVAGEVVLDPFTGSGSTLAAAHRVGCRFIGIEQIENFHRAACERLAGDMADESDANDSPS